MADGVFTFKSSPTPSAPGEAVTFTVSATGEADTPFGTLPPVGIVTLFADGYEIEGCSNLYLNVILEENSDPIFGNSPASCTTDALGEGSHEITATYLDGFEIYNQPSLSLNQQVGLSISPEILLNAEYQTFFSQQLTASGGVEPYAFALTGGSLPSGISLDSTGHALRNCRLSICAWYLPHHDRGHGCKWVYSQQQLRLLLRRKERLR